MFVDWADSMERSEEGKSVSVRMELAINEPEKTVFCIGRVDIKCAFGKNCSFKIIIRLLTVDTEYVTVHGRKQVCGENLFINKWVEIEAVQPSGSK